MSELINNSEQRKEMLKHLILQIHQGTAADTLRSQLVGLLQKIPYNDVVEVEQELIAEGLPAEEVLQFCDIHSMVLDGSIDTSGAQAIPLGHPLHTFKMENEALQTVLSEIRSILLDYRDLQKDEVSAFLIRLKAQFNLVSDVDKHYLRKEYLLFTPLEKKGITGPPTVMWGKHDEIREQLKNVHEALDSKGVDHAELGTLIDFLIKPAIEAVESMIMKEEEILFPMSMDALSETEWYRILVETPQFGYCLYDPEHRWKPESVDVSDIQYKPSSGIMISTGSFENNELEAMFEAIPIELTVVDKHDKVKFFSHGTKRVFPRSRAVLGRDVRLCHPPGSVHIVQQIMDDFKSGKENKAVFWISNFRGRFIYIEYVALRGSEGEYLGIVEFTQDATEIRQLQGDQRLLSYVNEKNE